MTNDHNDHNDHKCCNCPNSPHDQTPSWPFHYLSFTKVAKRFQLCKFSSKKLRIYPSSFLCKRSYVSTAQGVTGGCKDLEKCYSWIAFSMNAICESRFLWMLFASHVFYGSVRNSGDSLMTVVFMSSAKGVAICDGVLSSSSTCL